MASDLILTNDGIQFASGRILDIKAAMPSTGSYTAGDIVLESTTAARVSGWKRLTTGSGHVLNTDWAYFSGVASGTSVATTSGTAIDFTGVPSWARRVTVLLNGVSTNGTNQLQVQVGAGSVSTSGYTAMATRSLSGTNEAGVTTGFNINGNSATNTITGAMVISLLTGNTWVSSHTAASFTNSTCFYGSGSIALGGTLDRIRLTTVGGTDTFDAGSVNIFWE